MRQVYSQRPAESVTFRERFRNVATVHENGGVLVGSPAVKDGVTLDGSTQHVEHAVSTTVFSGRSLTILCRFSPDFEYDDSIDHYIFDTSAGSRYYVLKTSSNRLFFNIGDTGIASVAPAVWSQYWRVGQDNILIVSAETASTNAWLNGSQILVNDTTTWEPKTPAKLYTGASFAGSFRFDGVISELSMHSILMTQADVSAIQNDSLFTYVNRSELWVPMRSAIVDGSNDRTPDESRYGRTILLGDGAGTGTPTWESPGFSFDNIDDYMSLPVDPTGTFTVAWKRRGETVTYENDLTTWNKIKTAGQFSGTLEFLAWFPFSLSPIQEIDLDYQLRGAR